MRKLRNKDLKTIFKNTGFQLQTKKIPPSYTDRNTRNKTSRQYISCPSELPLLVINRGTVEGGKNIVDEASEMHLTETPRVEDSDASYQNNKQDSYFSYQTNRRHPRI